MRVFCNWRPIWLSKYERGQIMTVEGFSLERIYRNPATGQVRFYSQQNMDGVVVKVNSKAMLFRSRGRFGFLYISEKAGE